MMNSSTSFPQISDETLSAYLDGGVGAEERLQIESRLGSDADLAWRLESLRQTVLLLRALPAVQMPRTFTLESILTAERSAQAAQTNPAAVTEGAGTVRPRAIVSAPQPTFWERLGSFFNSGSLGLRNAAMVAAALFAVVLVGGNVLEGGRSGNAAPMAASAPAPMASQIESSAQESVALAPQSAAKQSPNLESASAVSQETSATAPPGDSAAFAVEASADEPGDEGSGVAALFEIPATESASSGEVAAEEVASEEVAPAEVAADSASTESASTESASTVTADAVTSNESALAQEQPAESVVSESAASAPAVDAPAAAFPGEVGGGGGHPGQDAGGPLPEGPAAGTGVRPPGPDSTGLDEAMGDTQGAALMPAPAASARMTTTEESAGEGAVAADEEAPAARESSESVVAESAAAAPAPEADAAASGDIAANAAAMSVVATTEQAPAEEASAVEAPAEGAAGGEIAADVATASASETTGDVLAYSAVTTSGIVSSSETTDAFNAATPMVGAGDLVVVATPNPVATAEAVSLAAPESVAQGDGQFLAESAAPVVVASAQSAGSMSALGWLLPVTALLGILAIVLALLWLRSRRTAEKP